MSLVIGKLVDKGFLFGLHLVQAFQFDGVSIEFGLFLVKEIVQIHHLLLPILGFAFPFISLTQGPQFFFFDFDCELVKKLCKCVHVFVERDDLHRNCLTFVMNSIEMLLS